MDLREQEYILAIAEWGNVTKAAEKLHISQPALSYSLAQLEKQLGTKLFHRYTKNFIPTPAGESYIRAARQMMVAKNEFLKELSDLNQFHSGLLRIGLPARRSPYIVPAFYAIFQKEYPHIEISFTEDTQLNLEQMLQRDELDFVLCNRSQRKNAFSYIALGVETFLLALPCGHPLASQAKENPETVYPWIDLRLFENERFFLQAAHQGQRYFSDLLFQQHHMEPKNYMVVENIETSTRMAALGLGISFVIDSYVKRFHFQPEPLYFSVGKEPFTVEFGAMHKKNAYIPAYTIRALEIIREIM